MATLPVTSARVPFPPSKLSYLCQRTPTHKHRGIDLVARKGTPVLAAESGLVTVASKVYRRGFSRYGRVIVIHGESGRHFLYAHLHGVAVEEGDRVREGQRIGSVGNTAFSKDNPKAMGKGAHLHFEVSPRPYPQASERSRLDPVAFLKEHAAAAAGGGLFFLALIIAGFWVFRGRK